MEPTGDLGRLLTWWHTHDSSDQFNVAWLSRLSTISAAESNVDRAVDEGATLIVIQTSGDALSARTTIAERTRKSPTVVRPLEDGMTDIDWMRDVATIRDLRAKGEPPGADILSAAAALERAQQRKMPVVFSGLTTHAGALLLNEVTNLCLPASSSTDAAITVAQEVLELRPALDLRLTCDDEYGPRAVVALLELLREV